MSIGLLCFISDRPMTEEEWALKYTGQPLPK
jgi:hypothetical protein